MISMIYRCHVFIFPSKHSNDKISPGISDSNSSTKRSYFNSIQTFANLSSTSLVFSLASIHIPLQNMVTCCLVCFVIMQCNLFRQNLHAAVILKLFFYMKLLQKRVGQHDCYLFTFSSPHLQPSFTERARGGIVTLLNWQLLMYINKIGITPLTDYYFWHLLAGAAFLKYLLNQLHTLLSFTLISIENTTQAAFVLSFML